MMLDAEGGTKPWCMKLLRHETGHALNYAYKLHGFHDTNLKRIFCEKKPDDNSTCFAHVMIERYRKNILLTVC
ncbi:MAG: hypothetical protein KJ893_07670 [Candidatus Omnitrophica bacterium]|nr:hypothetical protein [Candidatus Omnitrophota bacterium]MBU4478694.1 hypothetical protein [Candidatus Omnitrophota bacterium]